MVGAYIGRRDHALIKPGHNVLDCLQPSSAYYTDYKDGKNLSVASTCETGFRKTRKSYHRLTRGQLDVGDSLRGVKFHNRSRETVLALAMGVSLAWSQVPLAWYMRD